MPVWWPIFVIVVSILIVVVQWDDKNPALAIKDGLGLFAVAMMIFMVITMLKG